METPTFYARVARDGKRVLCGGHKDCGAELGRRASADPGEVQLFLPSYLEQERGTGVWRKSYRRPRRLFQHRGDFLVVRVTEHESIERPYTHTRQVPLPAVVECPDCRRRQLLDPVILRVHPSALRT
jgi:hypothetical protein